MPNDTSRRRMWHVRDGFHEWDVLRGRDRKPEDAPLLVPPMFVTARLRELLIFESSKAALLQAYAEISPGGSGRRSNEDLQSTVLPGLERAFRHGDLFALRSERRRVMETHELPVVGPDSGASEEVKTWLSIKILDETGQAIDGIEVVFSVDGGQQKKTTDGSGVARLNDVSASRGSVSIASKAELTKKVKPRWKEAREPKITVGPNVDAQELTNLRSISLDAETPFTLHIVPHFECTEVPGAHFEFGHSFVRMQAIEELSELAEELHEDDGLKAMIFAHTDKAGSEELNKELSERRAKAVYALFTHDTAAWMELWHGKKDGKFWKEKWGNKEAQHMLNALRVTDDKDKTLDEDGGLGKSTKQAIKKFQLGQYDDKPEELGPIPDTKGKLDDPTLEQLFKAYAMRITRKPVDKARIGDVGGSKFMGCGEYNPLTAHVKDDASRRCIVFTYEPAAEPTELPCQLQKLGPCKANLDPPSKEKPKEEDEGKPHYRCKIYQKIAKKCPCTGGPELSHDALIRIPFTLKEADALKDEFTLESEDGTIHPAKAVKSEARAGDDGVAEVYFTDLPDRHSYKLSSTVDGKKYTVFELTPFVELNHLSEETVFDAAAGLPPKDDGGLSKEIAALGPTS